MPGRKKKEVVDSSESEDASVEVKKGKKPAAKKAAAKKASPKKGKGAKETESPKKKKEEPETFNWWDMDESEFIHEDGSKWKTIEHAGPLFAPLYQPHGIPVKYEGETFKMTEAEEEVATFFAIMRQSHYYQKATYRDNFFKCWTEILYQRPEGRKIKELALCNFDDIYEWHLKQREIKKSLSRDEKRKLKEIEEEKVEKYKWVIWDGRKEKVANPRVEPPGLFQGRGLHPKMGMLKARVFPEDVTINCHDVKNPPAAPEGHKWGAIVSDPTVTWLAKWEDSITGDTKYTMVDPKSGALKQYTDRLKFEKARKLKDIIGKVREDYEAGFKSDDAFRVQMSVAMYFIDRLALRVGGEKGEDEADTVGCCSLRFEHVKPMVKEEDGKKQHYLHFDFLGKDSVRYVNDMPITKEVHGQVQKLLKGKDSRPLKENELFDLVSPSDLNKKFKDFMDGLSAKVFRTYNASYLLDQIFFNEPVNTKKTEAEKVVYFTNANTKVAILCNHQKQLAKGHEAAKENMDAKVTSLRDTHATLEASLEKLRKAKKAQFDKLWEKERDAFYETQDQMQRDWLDKWGTEAEVEKFEEIVAKRDGSKKAPSSPRAKKRKADSDDEEVVKRPKKAAKPAAKKKRALPSSDDESSESEPVVKRAKKAAKKAAAKKGGKKKEESESEESEAESSEDEKPKKKAAKKAAAKKGKKKEEAESEESEAESSEAASSEPKKKSAKKGAKKPGGKKK
eukprot:TRINITY_DN4154_c1_g2_i1.p1 TRINITY_DN4154_c1_g2~~TRINITY_DN4154_c1_g2_i1.p1  ORF type:complete len:734 (+),score=408.16 TRINITY_DN4154_c1_g2_i1:61-2262(+)